MIFNEDEMMHRTKRLFICLGIWFLGMAPAGWAAVSTEIKVALVTPEGSTWTQTLNKMAAAVEARTGGAVKLIIYAGGVSGDELDVLRKMQVNRLHAAGFSGVGLGVILPEVRILEAPLLFESFDEIDRVKNALYDYFAAEFEKKGYILLGFAEAGFVYFYSRIDLSRADALQQVKMWAWKGDPVAEMFLKSFGIKTFPLHVTDVNTGLETGMIDSFYAPPLAAVAFQWYSRIRFMLDYPMVNSTGALLMTRRQFMRLTPEHQAVLRETARDHCRELVRLTRRDNREALAVLAESGVESVKPAASQISVFKESARKTYENSIPKLYSRELFERVFEVLRNLRQ